MIILDKANKHFTLLIELLRKDPEVNIIDIKKVIPRSTYYASVVRKLFYLNKIFRELDPELYLAEPSFSVTHSQSVFTCVKRCPLIQIESKEGYFLIRC